MRLHSTHAVAPECLVKGRCAAVQAAVRSAAAVLLRALEQAAPAAVLFPVLREAALAGQGMPSLHAPGWSTPAPPTLIMLCITLGMSVFPCQQCRAQLDAEPSWL